jgi:DNA-binding transcriptional regulator YiaG
LQKDARFHELWSYDASERQKIKISFMVFSTQNAVDQELNEKYIKSFYDDEDDYNLRKLQREQKAKLRQKFYFNALITYADGKSFRTKGFSLYRHQIPELISVLNKITNGEFDEALNTFEKNNIKYRSQTGIGTDHKSIPIKKKKLLSDNKKEQKIEHLTAEEIEIRKKHQLTEEEFANYVNEIKNLSKKRH